MFSEGYYQNRKVASLTDILILAGYQTSFRAAIHITFGSLLQLVVSCRCISMVSVIPVCGLHH